MDETALFEQVHAALDAEPTPGAYDRLHAAMSTVPAATARPPLFRLRWTKMTLRITAAVAVLAITVALALAFVANHHPSVGEVPAGDTKNVHAYKNMMVADYNAMSSSTSNNCNTIADTGCADAINRIVPTLQKWVADMQAFPTPAPYAALDALLRAHLSQAAADLQAAVGFQKAGDVAGFNLAMNAAVYERAWIDPASFAIWGTYPNVASSYSGAITQLKTAVHNCVNGSPGPTDLACTQLSSQACSIGESQICEDYVQQASTQIEGFAVALVEFPAPSAQSQALATVQADLVQADAALLQVTAALLSRDTSKLAAAESSYTASISSLLDDSARAT
jgi:hypothetical protein